MGQQQHSVPQQPSVTDTEPPEKNPVRFSTSISNRAKLQTELVGTFFKDSVERARDRNGRSVTLFRFKPDSWLLIVIQSPGA